MRGAVIFLIANVLDGDAEAANQKLDEIAERIQQPLPPRTTARSQAVET
jgi:DNA-binding ferritin-like protein